MEPRLNTARLSC